MPVSNNESDSFDSFDSFDSIVSYASSKNLLKEIFKSNSPEQFVKQLPTPLLYNLIREQGLASTAGVIELVNKEQLQVFLDFDLWTKDRFDEERIWDWLELADETDDLSILKKVLYSIDLKIVSLLIARYVQGYIPEEVTEPPPEKGYSSPDKGHSWIKVIHPDATKVVLLKRFLALIFESSIKLYYQLLSVPQSNTQSVLEEQGYQEKCKRIVAEGVPSEEWAAELQRGLDIKSIKILLKKTLEESKQTSEVETTDATNAVPQKYANTSSLPSPLKHLAEEIEYDTEIQQELMLLLNSAIVHFHTPWWNNEAVEFLAKQVTGTLNLGLDLVVTEAQTSSLKAIYESLGFKKIYQLGVAKLQKIKKEALSFAESDDPAQIQLLESLQSPIPYLPAFLKGDGSFKTSDDSKTLISGRKPISTLEEVKTVEKILAGLKA